MPILGEPAPLRDGARARQAEAAARRGTRRGTMGRRVDWRRPRGTSRRRGWRTDSLWPRQATRLRLQLFRCWLSSEDAAAPQAARRRARACRSPNRLRDRVAPSHWCAARHSEAASPGSAAQWLGRWSLAALVGVNVDIGGGLEGLALGGAAGLGLQPRDVRTRTVAWPRRVAAGDSSSPPRPPPPADWQRWRLRLPAGRWSEAPFT